MSLFESLWVALSTYSILPSPQFEWTERSTRYAICFFPAVGVLCGGALYLWQLVCRLLDADALLFAAVAVCLPLLLTGGIHMDGYMDTVDALASHQDRARKLEILKDSHCGAFAILYCGMYLLACLGLWHAVYLMDLARVFCPAFVLSRSLSALCAVTMPNARRAGMLCAFTEGVQKHRATAAAVITALLSGALMVVLAPVAGGVGLCLGVLTLLYYRHLAMKQFGGVTGDTSGFFLQLCELAVLAGIWIGGLL